MNSDYYGISKRRYACQSTHQEGWLVGGHGKKQATECVKCGRCVVKIRVEKTGRPVFFVHKNEK